MAVRGSTVVAAVLLVMVTCARCDPTRNLGQNYSSVQEIVDACYAYLQSHELTGTKWGYNYQFYKPANDKYGPNQWLWDSGSHMIVWTHRNVSNSIADIRTMLQMQQPDGRIPEIIFWGPQTPTEELENKFFWSTDQYVDLTQMPLLPYSVRAIFSVTNDISLLEELVPPLVKYYQWWAETRDVDGNLIVSIIHSWESGMDASPAYDPAYHVTVPNPPFFELYPKFEELIIDYKFRYNWNQTEILGRTKEPFELIDGYFIVQDVGLNSVYASGWGVLADLAAYFDQDLSQFCRDYQSRVEAAVISQFWDEDLGIFISTYKDKDGNTAKSTAEVAQSLFPLLLQSLPKELQDSIVYNQVMNENKFNLAYPIPSVSASAAQFQPIFTTDLMWRGPTWPILTWFVMEGLQRHGYNSEMTTIMDKWVNLYELSGVYEQYNPLSGDGYGPEGLGMSTLIVDWIYRLGYL
ncbi:glycoside hydrolase family 63 protein [Pelomyxa schiedti]|nr:glycoside hydrolase family 63 protein [Pelomyxa schiedti]